MTLQSSGSMTFADINNELRSSGTLVFPDARTRWLAEVPSGNLVLPTNFYSKQAVKLVHSAVDTVDRSGSYTFSSCDFGIDYTGRTLVAVTALFAGSDQVLSQTSVTIGGSSAAGGNNGDGDPAGGLVPASAVGCGVWAAKPAGTSGSVVVNFTSGTAGAAALYLFSLAGAASATPHGQTSGITSDNPDFPSGDSGTLAVAANGVVVGGVARAVNTGAITLTGLTEVAQVTVDGSHRIVVGVANRLSVDAAYAVGFTTGSGNTVYAMRAASFN